MLEDKFHDHLSKFLKFDVVRSARDAFRAAENMQNCTTNTTRTNPTQKSWVKMMNMLNWVGKQKLKQVGLSAGEITIIYI